MTHKRLVLLRHGRTEWNAQRRFQGQADPPLDEVGRAQAYEVAAMVAALAPSCIVTSDAQRAIVTAQIVAEACGKPYTADARFRERSLGHWEGLTREEVEQRYPAEFAEWISGQDVSGRGGETRDEVAQRARAAIDELEFDETAIVVTHSATAMALCANLLGLDQRLHVLGPLANCHWTELTSEQGALQPWRLRAHNIGVPGTVAPLPARMAGEDATDADA